MSLGIPEFSFFHLITHAIFKSLLFLCADTFNHSLGDNQDISLSGSFVSRLPVTSSYFIGSSYALCGFPFLAGFYSKDLILKYFFISYINYFMCLVVIVRTVATITYNIRLLYYLYFKNFRKVAINSVYLHCSLFSFYIVLFLWTVIPFNILTLNYMFGGLFFFSCTRIGIYALIGRSWSSNSNYALLGAIRGIAQTISYEVSIALIFISLIFISLRYNFAVIRENQIYIPFFILFFPLFLCWLVTIFAETNRTPFDFAEGESELVSGFNVECGSGGFVLLFLAEYARIIFISYLISLLFLGGVGNLLLFSLNHLEFW